MPKLPKRLPYKAAVAAALLLGSCDGPNAARRFTNNDADRIDVADVNGRNAIAQIAALEERVEALEAKLGE